MVTGIAEMGPGKMYEFFHFNQDIHFNRAHSSAWPMPDPRLPHQAVPS